MHRDLTLTCDPVGRRIPSTTCVPGFIIVCLAVVRIIVPKSDNVRTQCEPNGRLAFNTVVAGWHDGIKFLADNVKCFVSESFNLLIRFYPAVAWNFSIMQAAFCSQGVLPSHTCCRHMEPKFLIAQTFEVIKASLLFPLQNLWTSC